MEKWARIIAQEMRSQDRGSTALEGVSQSQAERSEPLLNASSASTRITSQQPRLVAGLRGDDPIEESTPKLTGKKSAPIPGYVSKFTQYPPSDDKELIESIEDTYK